MNLDQATNTIEKTASEKMSVLRQEAIRLNEEIAEIKENGANDSDPVLLYTKEKLSKVLDELSSMEGDPVEVAENIAEKELNKNNHDIEQQMVYHNKLLSKAVELNTFYTDKKAEAEDTLKNVQPGTQEYIITENLIAQYDKQIKSSEESMNSNKKAIEQLEAKA